MPEKEKILLGSGQLYFMEYTGAIPEPSVIEVEANRLGHISGGATLEYKPTYYTAKDDKNVVSKTITTEEEVKFKTGLITFNGNVLANICSTARVTETAGKRTVKIGGINNDNGKKYIFRFVHDDKIDGDVRVTVVGRNQSGFSLAFAKDKETVADVEITAESCDAEGTLVIYEEEIPGVLTVTSAAGTVSGKTKITVAETLTIGNSYKYKTAASVVAPAIGDDCSTGYTVWNGTDEITATTGNTIVVVEANSLNKVVAVGSTTVTSKV